MCLLSFVVLELVQCPKDKYDCLVVCCYSAFGVGPGTEPSQGYVACTRGAASAESAVCLICRVFGSNFAKYMQTSIRERFIGEQPKGAFFGPRLC
jgi:hypothetical protein